MDGDLFGDALVDDLLNFTRESSGDFDTSDLMDILEPDHLENNILLDDAGSLDHMPDVAALDDLDALAMSTENPIKDVADTKDSSDQAPAAASLDTALDDIGSDTDDEQEEEEDYDPLEALTSSMLPEDDLEALARLAAGDDVATPSDQSEYTYANSVDSLLTDDDLGTSFDDADTSTTDLSPDFADDVLTMRTPSKSMFEDTLDERFQPNAAELEELAMLASGLAEHSGEDLGSLASLTKDEETEDEETEDEQAEDTHKQPLQGGTTQEEQADLQPRTPKAKRQTDPQHQPVSQQSASSPHVHATDNNEKTRDQQTPESSHSIRQFSQFASTWQSQTALVVPETPSEQVHLAPESTPSQTPYRPPNQLHRHFNASIMLEAADRLKEVLDIPDIPVVVFLGRAAERCLSRLDGHDVVSVSQLAGNSFVPSFHVPQQESFRHVLMAKHQADTHKTGPHANHNKDTSERPLLVADISELELDDLSIALEGSHLLLTRLQVDSTQQHLRGTLTLIGDIDLHSGAMFLKAIKNALESPITLMV